MHITKIKIENIRSIEKLEWKIPEDQAAGWHVILGDNGSGKSTFVRAVAIALVGPRQPGYVFFEDWEKWIRHGTSKGRILLNMKRDSQYDTPEVTLSDSEPSLIDLELVTAGDGNTGSRYKPKGVETSHVVKDNGSGWFSASYGPFRRFTGGHEIYENILKSNLKVARHLSAFYEGVALTEGLQWLKDLRFKQLEKRPEGELLKNISLFLNQTEFLPNNVCLAEVTSDAVNFVDGNGYSVSVEELSDGYRSVLSMTFELIRQLAKAYGADRIFDSDDPTKIVVPGVVLIDEVDAHLHPTWQRKIGWWFKEHFPNMQFIVTTHSPLICQAAAEGGTVFCLPASGSSEVSRMIVGVELDRLLYGNVLEAYGTQAFDMGMTRSEKSHEMLEQLAGLNIKELEEGLTPEEEERQNRLRAALPTTANILYPNGVKTPR